VSYAVCGAAGKIRHDLSVGPMIEMLAAGNRVMVKPSEFTPASAALLRDMVARAFDPTLVYVASIARRAACRCRLRRAGRAAVAGIRRGRRERHGPPPRPRRLPRVLQSARRRGPR
jgi:hypothetical protein